MNQKFIQASCRATLHKKKKNFSSNLNFFDVIDHRCWNEIWIMVKDIFYLKIY